MGPFVNCHWEPFELEDFGGAVGVDVVEEARNVKYEQG